WQYGLRRPFAAGNSRWHGGADRGRGSGSPLPGSGPLQAPGRSSPGDSRTGRNSSMREDEFKQLKEQRMQLVTELRAFSDAMQERASIAGGKILAEDQEEYDKREKDLVEI